MVPGLTHGQTVLTPLAILILLLGLTFLFILPRDRFLFPFLIVSIFVSMQQRIVVGGADFTFLRIMVLAGLFRSLLRNELLTIKFNTIDKLFICWVISRVITYTILWQTPGAFVNRVGNSIDSMGVYFLIRTMIKKPSDVERIIKWFAVLCLPLALSMLYEWNTSRNLFSLFGGVPDFTFVRDGRLRCQGPFQHPILAGSFGASLAPVFLVQLLNKKDLKYSAVGLVSSGIITFTSSSSGPVLTFLAGMGGLSFWFFREHIQLIRWCVVLGIMGLHLVMTGPVWSILMRLKVFSSSTGYHRYNLIDQFIKRVGEWFLVGVHTTEHWGHYGLNLADVTNHYIRIAVDGGFISLLFFTLALFKCFRHVGLAYERLKGNLRQQLFIWSIGAALFSHAASFMGVSYFDQILVNFFSICAITAALPKCYASTSQRKLSTDRHSNNNEQSYRHIHHHH